MPYGSETYKYLSPIVEGGETLAVIELSGRHDVYNGYRPAVLDSLEQIHFEGVKALDISRQPLNLASLRVAESERLSEAPSGGYAIAAAGITV